MVPTGWPITNQVNSVTASYNYDATGNVIKDEKQQVQHASWNVYGKLQEVIKADNTQIAYQYDAAGQRIAKTVADTTELYVRDASGNIMSVYKNTGSGVWIQEELHIYGSELLGIRGRQTVAPQETILPDGQAATLHTFTRREMSYYLKNHLSSTGVIITDRKRQHSTDGQVVDYYEADIKSATYYSAYGAITKSYSEEEIKYGFNGQMRSREISVTAQTALFWEYDGDVGRRWNVDPKPKAYEGSYVSFANNPLRFMDPNGADTIDVKSKTFDHLGRKKGQKGFDEKNMMILFTVKTHETHATPYGDEIEFRREMSSSRFLNEYTLNSSIPVHTIFDSERKEFKGRIPVMSIVSVNTKHLSFGEAVNVIGVESLESIRNSAVSHLKSRWWSPLNMDKVKYFQHGGKYDIKGTLLKKSPLTFIKGVGLYESDYLGNLVYGAIMGNFQSLTSSLTDGDQYQNTGYDDVSDSHGIIIGHFEGKSRISVTTFQKVSKYNLDKWTFIQGKVYNEYNINIQDTGKELQLKTNH